VLLGVSTEEHLRLNVAAGVGVLLDDVTLEVCDALWEDLRRAAPSYNR